MCPWRLLLAICAATMVLSAASPAQELIGNGGFEQPAGQDQTDALPADIREFYAGSHPSPFAGWRFGGGWEGGQYTVHSSTEAHSGRTSCQIRCVRKGRGGIASSPFKLRPGTIVEVSMWVKAQNANGGRLAINFEGSPGDGWDRVDLDGGTYDWKQIVHRCIIPVRHERADGQTLVLFVYLAAEGSLWVDDVSVRTIDVNVMAEAPDVPATVAPRARSVPEPAGSIGYRVDVASSLDKVLPDKDFAPQTRGEASVALARNEHEAVQVVVEAPWRDVPVRSVEVSPLRSAGGALIPASAVTWNRVDFVETTVKPLYPVKRMGLYPDPLMPAGPFTVKALTRTPLWIDFHTARDTPAGTYQGTITLTPDGMKPTVVPLTVTVWDFALPDESHLRTLTWLGTGVIRAFYGYKWTPEDNRRFEETIHRYQDMLLEHRLGPGGEVAAHVARNSRTGQYDFSAIDANLERLIGKGMNAFIMGTAPNLKRARLTEYTPQFIADFSEMLKAYGDHLREKGWLDKAYVYTYDEAPRSAWPEVRKISRAIRTAAPGLRILQCLNEPEGVKELADSVDVFDVYVAQYHKAGVSALQKKGNEVWLAVCCYPMSHPNLFIEYPLIDARLLAPFCWKYNAQGFEYWSPTSWGSNWKVTGPEQWPATAWNPNSFGRYNGDGYPLYPGPNGVPYSCIRLEAFRDGMEDYEYLWLLKSLRARAQAAGKAAVPAVAAADHLLTMDEVIRDDGTFSPDEANYLAFRQKVAASIVELQNLLQVR